MSAVTLVKATDGHPEMTPVPLIFKRSVALGRYLQLWEGPLSSQMRGDLARNDLRGLSDLLYLASNDPTPGQ